MKTTMLQLKGASVILGSVYMVVSLGAKGMSLELFESIGLQLSLCGRPFVLAGDWNMSISELDEVGFLSRANACVLALPEGARTCLQGKGSQIDFYVVSLSLLPLIRSEGLEVEVPWRPHVAVMASLLRRPREVEALVARKPRDIPPPLDPKLGLAAVPM